MKHDVYDPSGEVPGEYGVVWSTTYTVLTVRN